MLKKTLLATMLAILILAVPAMAGTLAGTDIDGTPWDWSFDGIDFPTLPPETGGFVNIAMNSSQYNGDYKIGFGHLLGWLTSNGNPGGSYGLPNILIAPGPPSVSQVYPGFTKATGWTLEWNFVNYNTQTVSNVFSAHDDVGGVAIDFAPNLVTIRDGLGSDSASIAVDMSDITVAHTFRVVRLPDSPTVELYVDNDWGNPVSVTPTVAAWPAADGGNVNYLSLQTSSFEASLDWVGLHTGATPATNLYGDVNLDGFVGGEDITRIVVNWGIASPVYSQGDVNNDGVIGAADYNAVLNNWGDGTLPPPEAPGTIPEPNTMLLLAGGLLAVFIRHR